MKVLVLGSGIIGVTTGWFLVRDGHEVTVIDRRDAPAAETSFANAGFISPGHASSWAAPGVPAMWLRSQFRKDAPLKLRLRADPAMWEWCLRFLRNCTEARWRANSLRKLELCLYSQRVQDALVADTGLEFHRCTDGILYLYRERAALTQALEQMRLLTAHGIEVEVLDADGCVRLEPALAGVRAGIAGAFHCPGDESGDCNLFTRSLAELSAARGVTFRMGTEIRNIVADGARIVRVETDAGPATADAYVMALGSYSAVHARRLGIRLPVYPLKGYSATVTARPGAPAMPGVDDANFFAWSRFGDRLRLTSVAELDGYDTRPNPAYHARLLRIARALFPDGGDYGTPDFWAGLRPMTPQGTPIFGRRRFANLWFNTGHGSMGWSMGCGSARITADLIAGRKPEIDLAGMTLEPA